MPGRIATESRKLPHSGQLSRGVDNSRHRLDTAGPNPQSTQTAAVHHRSEGANKQFHSALRSLKFSLIPVGYKPILFICSGGHPFPAEIRLFSGWVG